MLEELLSDYGSRKRKVHYLRPHTKISDKFKNEVIKVLGENVGEYLQKFL